VRFGLLLGWAKCLVLGEEKSHCRIEEESYYGNGEEFSKLRRLSEDVGFCSIEAVRYVRVNAHACFVQAPLRGRLH